MRHLLKSRSSSSATTCTTSSSSFSSASTSSSSLSASSSSRRLGLLRTRDTWTLARSRRWDDLRAELSTDRGARQAINAVNLTGHSLLHAAISFDPPVDIVRTLIQLNPAALANGGATSTLPIHAAVAYGASLDVIRTLVTESARIHIQGDDGGGAIDEFGDKGAVVAVRDAFGRTSIHLAVQRACDDCEEDQDEDDGADAKDDECRRRRDRRHRQRQRRDHSNGEKASSKKRSESLAVLAYLCRCCPDVIAETDESGESALDAALFQGTGGRDGPVASVMLEEVRKAAEAKRRSCRRRSVNGALSHSKAGGDWVDESIQGKKRRKRRDSAPSPSTCNNDTDSSDDEEWDNRFGRVRGGEGGDEKCFNDWHDMNQLREMLEWTRRQRRYRTTATASRGKICS